MTAIEMPSQQSEQSSLVRRCAAWLITIVIGFICAIAFRVNSEGFFAGNWLLWTPAGIVACVLLNIANTFRKSARPFGRARNWFWGILSAVTFFACGCILARTVPDPAFIYLNLQRSHIEAHWQKDPKSGIEYYPIDYSGVGGGRIAPRNFYMREADNRVIIADEYTNRLTSPSCPNAKYSARRLDEKIYFVRFFIDDPDESSEPCLVTPTLQISK